jgi:hypothetical protein
MEQTSMPARWEKLLLALAALLLAFPAGADTRSAIYRCAMDMCELTSNGETSGDAILALQSENDRRDLRERGFSRPEELETTELDCQGFIQSIVIFTQPRQATLELLSQTERQMEFLPTLRDVRPVARHERESLDHHEIKIIFTKLQYRVHNHWSYEEWVMWWYLDPGYSNDMSTLDGYWRFYELEDGRTLAIYASRIDVGPLIPARMQTALSRKKLEESLRHFRGWVNSGGSYRP